MKADGHATKAMANLNLYLSPQIATCEIKRRVVNASISISNADGLVVVCFWQVFGKAIDALVDKTFSFLLCIRSSAPCVINVIICEHTNAIAATLGVIGLLCQGPSGIFNKSNFARRQENKDDVVDVSLNTASGVFERLMVCEGRQRDILEGLNVCVDRPNSNWFIWQSVAVKFRERRMVRTTNMWSFKQKVDTTLTFCLSLSTAARTSSQSTFEADNGIRPSVLISKTCPQSTEHCYIRLQRYLGRSFRYHLCTLNRPHGIEIGARSWSDPGYSTVVCSPEHHPRHHFRYCYRFLYHSEKQMKQAWKEGRKFIVDALLIIVWNAFGFCCGPAEKAVSIVIEMTLSKMLAFGELITFKE